MNIQTIITALKYLAARKSRSGGAGAYMIVWAGGDSRVTTTTLDDAESKVFPTPCDAEEYLIGLLDASDSPSESDGTSIQDIANKLADMEKQPEPNACGTAKMRILYDGVSYLSTTNIIGSRLQSFHGAAEAEEFVHTVGWKALIEE